MDVHTKRLLRAVAKALAGKVIETTDSGAFDDVDHELSDEEQDFIIREMEKIAYRLYDQASKDTSTDLDTIRTAWTTNHVVNAIMLEEQQ